MLKCVSSINQGFVRSYVLISLLGQRPFKPNPPVYASLLVIVSVNINIYLSAAYATERILATIFMRTYEKQRPYYGVGFAALIVSEHGQNRVTRQSEHRMSNSHRKQRSGLMWLIASTPECPA